ncbi:nickel-binding protein [Pseudanabaena sp. PCC 6802]|uniref:nickel-binding protein n=1 Tax=Pseudanabaena sp. PCC 6802 TaxID=118173 RepID=UPI00034B821A|nr:nickel-binding protein [Pseudanabaena sp. PCC 6802]
MSLVIVETLADSPLVPEEPTETDLRVLGCLTERQSTWRYSLLSHDRLRMICTFDAPDVESVRESYRKGGGVFTRMWAGEPIEPEGVQPQRNTSTLKVAEATFPNGFTQAEWDAGTRRALPCYAERGSEFIQSYLSLDRTRLICEFNPPDAEVIRQTRYKLGIPCDRVWSAMVISP